MLTRICIRDFVLITELDIEFSSGLIALTGETGTGKSILIDAIGLALGERASSNIIKANASKTDITIEFNIKNNPPAQEYLKTQEIEASQCLIRRVITREGKSKSYINNIPVTQAVLAELANYLIHIHGQQAFQHLNIPMQQRAYLDRFAKHDILLNQINALYAHWKAAQDQLDQLNKLNQTEENLNYLTHELSLLKALDLKPDEVNALESERKYLSQINYILSEAQSTLALLSDENNQNIIQTLSIALDKINKLAMLNPTLLNISTMLNNALVECEESEHELSLYLNNENNNPEKLSLIEERLTKIYDLARKHRIEPQVIPDLINSLEQQVILFQQKDQQIQQLNKQIKALEAEYIIIANKLSQSRQKQAALFCEQVMHYMHQLGMPEAKFSIEFLPLPSTQPSIGGQERVQFMIAINPGQDLQPLSKVASGGELSRISLAIELTMADCNQTPTLIFDEIDTGIGGRTADHVGLLLRQLGQYTQVCCVTHLAQIAGKAHQHFRIEKKIRAEKTDALITELLDNARLEEIARMLGGLTLTPQALAHAKEIILAN